MLDTIINAINDRTEAAEYAIYNALYAVLTHWQEIVVEWATMRFPVVEHRTIEQIYARKLRDDVLSNEPPFQYFAASNNHTLPTSPEDNDHAI